MRAAYEESLPLDSFVENDAGSPVGTASSSLFVMIVPFPPGPFVSMRLVACCKNKSWGTSKTRTRLSFR